MWDAIEGYKVARNENIYQICFQDIGLECLAKNLINCLMD